MRNGKVVLRTFKSEATKILNPTYKHMNQRDGTTILNKAGLSLRNIVITSVGIFCAILHSHSHFGKTF